MFRNYLKIATRSLLKAKMVSMINIVGLAFGIASFIMMMAYVIDELNYERFNSRADRIFRVVYTYEASGERRTVAKTAFPLKYEFLKYPQVEKVVRFFRNRMDAATLKYGDQLFTEDNILFTDPEIFEVFDYEWISGNPETALTAMNSIVLTQSMAVKYFGDENPVGETLLYKNSDQLDVTGVIADVKNSHIDFDFLVPTELQRQRWMNEASNNGYDFEKDWKWSGAWTYVLLKNGSVKPEFDKQLLNDGIDYFGRLPNSKIDYLYQAQPLPDIHLKSDAIADIGVNGNLSQVYAFGAIAILILIIACINFINLTTAQSAYRAKEIGLRKVMGAHRIHLIWQFITESVLVTTLGMGLGLVLLEVMLPFFNMFMEKELSIPYLQIPKVSLLILLGTIAVGFLSGFYPSFYLSRFKPVKTLKGNYESERSNVGLRKSLVIGQFIVSNVLIIGIIVVQMQLDYLKGKDLGFDKKQVIILKHGTKIDDKLDLFQQALHSNPGVEVVNQGYVAGTGDWNQSFRVNGEDLEAAKGMGFKHVSYGFVEMYDLEIVAGRNFSRQHITDSANAIMLNEAAVRNFGWTNDEALGQTFTYIGGSDNKTRYVTKVVGVLKDANFESLYEQVHPSVFKLSNWGDVAIKLNASNKAELFTTIESIEAEWNKISPQWPFEFSFLDQQIEAQYKKEERLGQMIQFFAFIAILIACLGLFGLATFTVQKKTKEIGVRKVLGASIASIVLVIAKGFLVLVVVSFIISIPLGYYLALNWLADFAFSISLSPFIFISSGIISVVVAVLAVSSQSVKAARLNPVKTLRYE